MKRSSRQILTFGEIMLRITPAHAGERIVQASGFSVSPGGSEANVAVALSLLGSRCGFITRLPDNSLSEKIERFLHQYSVDTSDIANGGSRLGVYWTETGKGPRASQVLYDREDSSFATMRYSDFNWSVIFKNTSWFHVSGITPAVSRKAYDITRRVTRGIPKRINLSIDLNYRSKLWKWTKGKKASIHKAMREICTNAYLITGNESDFFDSLGIGTRNDKSSGDHQKTAESCFALFPKLNYMAISLRNSISASENEWSGLLFEKKNRKISVYKGPEFKITDIVDRVGTGDSFSAGIIHGLTSQEKDMQHTVDFAVGLSALNHTVMGDASQFGIHDVEHLLKNPGSRIIR
jgi:2-dehydro-3-deoxygluconokinase